MKIKLTEQTARNVWDFSLFPSEDEILLPPNVCLKKTGAYDAGHGLVIIDLDQTETMDAILNIWPQAPLGKSAGDAESCVPMCQRDQCGKPTWDGDPGFCSRTCKNADRDEEIKKKVKDRTEEDVKKKVKENAKAEEEAETKAKEDAEKKGEAAAAEADRLRQEEDGIPFNRQAEALKKDSHCSQRSDTDKRTQWRVFPSTRCCLLRRMPTARLLCGWQRICVIERIDIKFPPLSGGHLM